MKKTILILIRVLLLLVLLGIVLNWFLNFNDATNQLIYTAMFCLIGISYIIMGFAWDKKLVQALIVFCGIFLIVMNFVPGRTWISIVGIVCILVPMIIARFQKKEKDSSEVLLEN